MIKTLCALSAAALIAVSPAAARAKAEPAPAPVGAPIDAKAPRYCVVETLTGSLLPRRLCKTRDEWIARGYDPVVK